MAEIILFSQENLLTATPEIINFDGAVGEFLLEKYSEQYEKGAPTPFSVFHGVPCKENDITFDVDRLFEDVDGRYTITETPSAEVAIYIIVAIVVAVVVIELTPLPELPKNLGRPQESPNNQLKNRNNTARPLERVPDIKGQLLSVPDFIAPTYLTYDPDSFEQIEHALLCVGRKRIEIDVLKEGDTPINLITGSSAGIYYPSNSANKGDPDFSIGGHESEPIYSAYKSSQASNLDIPFDGDAGFIKSEDTTFQFISGQNVQIGRLTSKFGEWPENYVIGEDASVNAGFGFQGVNAVFGEYEVLGFSESGGFSWMEIDLVRSINRTVKPVSGSITAESANVFSDWFYLLDTEFDRVVLNMIAPNGIYRRNNDGKLRSLTIGFDYEIEPVDIDGNPSGTVYQIADAFNAAEVRFIGRTTEFQLPFPTRVRVRARKLNESTSASASDTLKWGDFYGMRLLPETHDFGDVTTIQTIVRSTPEATGISRRELNGIAHETLNVYEGDGVFSPDLTRNNSAVQSLIADSLDPIIGNRQLDEVDADGLLDMEQEIIDYFGAPEFAQFSYTFDSTDITFQQIAQITMNAINSIAFREGIQLKAYFERPQEIPAMLFTHRSKIPNDETYTRDLNKQRNHDGVEFNWIDPTTNTTETIYLPLNRTAINPKSYNIVGIRNERQAIVRALREFNKLNYQKERLQFTATAEGRFARIGEMISVVKGSRTQTFDGEILAVDGTGLLLTLSQDVEFTPLDTHSITLKKRDGSTQNIECFEVAGETDQVLLSQLPDEAISTEATSRRTEFSFGNDARQLAERWIPQEINLADKVTVGIIAINYQDQYYQNDLIGLNAFSDGFSDGFS